METISELREICRKKHKKGVTKPHWWASLLARRVSIYITWLIVRHTNISANQVTIWQLIASLIGIGLLCFANTWIAFVGIFFLHLGYIFDNVDGEVARYRKSQSINGMFLDFVNHEVIIPMTFACLSFHYYFLLDEIIFFGLGLLVIIIKINPVGKGRLVTIYFLVEKRKSPTYDIRNYQQDNFVAYEPTHNNITLRKNTINLIKKVRNAINKLYGYPNDILIITVLIVIELLTKKAMFCSYFLVLCSTYLVCNFILDLYWHLKNNIVEKEFFKTLYNVMEISKDFNNK